MTKLRGMKWKTLVGALLILSLMILSGMGRGTSAYLQDLATKINYVQPAAIRITINESGFANNATALQPGVAATKPVRIVNEATAADGRVGTDAYIRAALVPVWRRADGTGSALPVSNVVFGLAATAGTDWMLGKDGYYYYKNPVAPGASTTQLLSSVRWNLTGSSLDTEYMASRLEVQVLADAIQTIARPVEDYWSVTVDNSTGSLVLTPANTP